MGASSRPARRSTTRSRWATCASRAASAGGSSSRRSSSKAARARDRANGQGLRAGYPVMSRARVFALTLLAMTAFAGNSLLCRLALKHTGIDPASFTSVRILSGSLALWLIVRIRGGAGGAGNWPSALALFAYAAAFSFAYVGLPAAAGALLLFGSVQATMFGYGLLTGERLRARQVAGLVL